jgi:SAM-dependent methyltransferase
MLINRYLKVAINRVKNKYRAIAHRGKIVKCDLCGWKGKFFYDGRCPKCNSQPRTRLIPFSIRYFHLEDQMENILHVAPNRPEYLYISNNIKFKVYDRMDIVKRSIVNLHQDLTHNKIESELYDISILWHVLEHIPNDRDAISELYRVTKAGGKVLISVPIFPHFRKETYEDKNIPRREFLEIHGHADHCRSCGLDYYKRFEDVGFKTQTLNVNELKIDDIKKFGLSVTHVVWIFEK